MGRKGTMFLPKVAARAVAMNKAAMGRRERASIITPGEGGDEKRTRKGGRWRSFL